MELKGQKFATWRLVVDASRILMLKDHAASTDVPQPTRIEAMTSLTWMQSLHQHPLTLTF
ncbi:hypothetical protein CRYUN_Cryun21dG0055100 [Craigia yunnanensis]